MVIKSIRLKKIKIKVIYEILKIAWRLADGKKTISGLFMIIAGLFLYLIPGGQKEANKLLITGIPIFIIGIGHKIKKHKTKKEAKAMNEEEMKEQTPSYGIKETKELLQFIVSLANALKKVSEDGWNWNDAMTLLPALTKFPKAIDGFEQIVFELDDLDATEEQELLEVVSGLNFVKEKKMEIVRQALITGIDIFRLVEMIADKFPQEEQ